MSGYQKLIVVGYLGSDPVMRLTSSGKAVTSFPVATSRFYIDGNGNKVDETTWLRVSVWDQQAEMASKYLRKGSFVLVEGRLKPDPETGGPRIWTGKDGQPHANFEVTAQTVRFLPGGKSGAVSEAASEPDNIPF